MVRLNVSMITLILGGNSVKKFLVASLMFFIFACMPVYAHHAAEDMVDEDVYNMIDELVEDTPHADMTLEELGRGMTELTITTETYSALMNLLNDGLLELVVMLDGKTTITYDVDQGEFLILISSMGANNSSYSDRRRSY